MSVENRPRRSCLAVPGSSQKFIDKARTLPADQVFLDLEDACAPLAKPGPARPSSAALNEGGWEGKTRVVRVNDWTTEWTYRDVTEVVEGAGRATSTRSCCRRCRPPSRSHALDLLLTQIEKTMGYEVGRIGIEAQIENAMGLTNVNAIAAASPRIETIIFGPADFMASINMKSLVVGEQPPGYDVGDAYHYILMQILMAARAYDLQAIDGPVPADPRRRRLPPRRRPLGGAGLRRQVGAAPRPDRRRERGLLARRRTTTTTPRTSSTPTSTSPPRPAARRARRCSATR